MFSPIESRVKRYCAATFYTYNVPTNIRAALRVPENAGIVAMLDRVSVERCANGLDAGSVGLHHAHTLIRPNVGDERTGRSLCGPGGPDDGVSVSHFHDPCTADATLAATAIAMTVVQPALARYLPHIILTAVGETSHETTEMLQRGRPAFIHPSYAVVLLQLVTTLNETLSNWSWLEVSETDFYAEGKNHAYWREFCAKSGI